MPMGMKRLYERPSVTFVEISIGCPLAVSGGGSLPPGVSPEPFGGAPFFGRSGFGSGSFVDDN